MKLRASSLLVALVAMLTVLPAQAQSVDCEAGMVSVHCGAAPSATLDEQGRLWVAFVQNQHVYVSRAAAPGQPFAEPVVVNPVPEDAEHNGENRPKIVINGDEVYVSWTLKTSPRFTGEIRFSRSTDEGRSFAPPRTINDDNLFAGHRFESLYQTESGHLYLTWIDKRDLQASIDAGEDYSGAAVYYAVSTDGGASFSQNYRVANHSCECCRIAIAPRGEDSIAILWRQIFGVTTRDHAIAVLTPDGEMQDMHRASYDNWQIDACPHHGPTMVSGRDSNDYHMSWFSNGDLHQGVYYGRFSFTDGRPHAVREVDASPGAGHPYLAMLDDTLHLIWKGFDGSQSLIYHQQSRDQGESWSPRSVLASTQQGSDHPLIVSGGGALYLSWKTDQYGYVFQQFAGAATEASD